jgi:probable HAF family extracellular repeat protein
MDQAGRVVGWSLTRKGETHAFSWSGHRMKDLNPHRSSWSKATAVDIRGDRVALQLREPTIHAAILDQGRLVDLGPPAGIPPGQSDSIGSASLVGFADGLAVGSSGYRDYRGDSQQRLWLWDGSAIRVLPMVVDNPRYSQLARSISRRGTIAIEEYPLDLFSPFWETAVYGGGSVRVAYTGEYPQGIDPHGFHIWQMDENGTLVGGIKQSFPVFNGSYAAIARDGAISYLPGLGGISSNALAINGRGEIAGWAQDSASNQVHLVIWRPRSTLLAATGR